jgi:hypothetical protein
MLAPSKRSSSTLQTFIDFSNPLSPPSKHASKHLMPFVFPRQTFVVPPLNTQTWQVKALTRNQGSCGKLKLLQEIGIGPKQPEIRAKNGRQKLTKNNILKSIAQKLF